MTRISATRLGALAFLATAAVAGSARADVLLQTATYTGTDTGDYIATDGSLIGVDFTLARRSTISSIGAGIGRFGSGQVFAAIVAVDPATGLPTLAADQIAANALATAIITVPSAISDVTQALLRSVTLDAGAYAVVFGSTAGSAVAGVAPLSASNAATGTATFFQQDYGATTFSTADLSGVRVVVNGVAVPEPATAALFMVGVLGLAARRGRRG